MTISIRNLSIVKKADIEIGGLTVLCGKNNSGKTYVTHAIYGILDQVRKNANPSVMEKIVSRAEREGKMSIGDADVKKIIQEGVDSTCKQANKFIPKVLATDAKRTQEADVSVSLTTPFGRKGRFEFTDDASHLGIRYRIAGNVGGGYELSVANADNSKSVVEKQEYDITKRFLRNDFAMRIQSLYVPKVFICSAERTGAAIFQRELDFTRSRLIDLLSRSKTERVLSFDLVGKFVAEYPLAVRGDIDFVREFPSRCSRKGVWAAGHEKLLNEFSDIVGGQYVVSDAEVRFSPVSSSKTDVKLKMSESSSSVRALMDLAGYLKCYAQDGDLLIVDEPEMNLHPENQRRLARFFASLVNAGLNVFITTHSDYIVKEFNLLLLMNSKSAREKRVAERNGYDESSLLKSADVHFYITQEDAKEKGKRVVDPIRVTQEGGIDKSSFDETIDSMNRLFDELYWGE